MTNSAKYYTAAITAQYHTALATVNSMQVVEQACAVSGLAACSRMLFAAKHHTETKTEQKETSSQEKLLTKAVVL